MRRNGFNYRKCGPIPAKVDNERQQEWMKNTLTLVIEVAKNEELHLFFCDAAHFILRPFICFLWFVSRALIRGSAGRNGINMLVGHQ